jgi:hypothetical protein
LFFSFRTLKKWVLFSMNQGAVLPRNHCARWQKDVSDPMRVVSCRQYILNYNSGRLQQMGIVLLDIGNVMVDVDFYRVCSPAGRRRSKQSGNCNVSPASTMKS